MELSMTRWISSTLCTIAFAALLFCLPVWGIKSASVLSKVSDRAASAVHIVKRVPKQAPPAVPKQNVQTKSLSSIPARPAEPLPVQEPEPAESPNEPAETSDAEASDESQLEGAEESGSDSALPASGMEDSSRMQDAKAVATYKSYALGRIASKKKYPYTARSNGFEGKVRVRIVINPDGMLAQADILEPSEYEILNNACLAAIKKAAPFKKMSGGMNAMTLTFVMDFSLK